MGKNDLDLAVHILASWPMLYVDRINRTSVNCLPEGPIEEVYLARRNRLLEIKFVDDSIAVCRLSAACRKPRDRAGPKIIGSRSKS